MVRTTGIIGKYCAWIGMQNLLHNSQVKVTRDNVVVGMLSVPGTCENQEGFSPNCEYGISHGCDLIQRNMYVTSRSPMTEMGRIIDETAAIIGSTWNQYGVLGRYMNDISDVIFQTLKGSV